MRGQQSLFKHLFEREQKDPDKDAPRNYLLPERNIALVYRYYFHADIERLRYDDCLHALEKEFYLSQARIIVLLSENTDQLSQLVNDKPAIKKLATRFPHFNWSLRSKR